MAQSSWPSPDTSRVVNDFQYEKMAIAYGPTAGLQGSPTFTDLVYGDSTGMQVKIRSDRYAIVRGYEWTSGPTEFTKTISANASGSTRVDLIVLRLSRTTWNVTVEVVAGTPGAGAPAATQNTGDTGVWELPLATVTVANGAATITSGNVVFLGVYLDPGGAGYVVGSTAALANIPGKYDGMAATVGRNRFLYNGSAWVFWSAPPLFVRKAANQTKTSTITPANDDHLVLPVEANATYSFQMCLFHNTMAAAGLRTTFAIPTSAVLTRWGLGPVATGDSNNASAAQITQWNAMDRYNIAPFDLGTGGLSQATAWDVLHLNQGILITFANAGNLQLKWAQLFSSATNTIVLAESWLQAQRIA